MKEGGVRAKLYVEISHPGMKTWAGLARIMDYPRKLEARRYSSETMFRSDATQAKMEAQ